MFITNDILYHALAMQYFKLCNKCHSWWNEDVFQRCWMAVYYTDELGDRLDENRV